MQSKSSSDPNIDRTRFGNKKKAEVRAETRTEKKALGLSGEYKRFRAHVGGITYGIPIPDVRAIRQQMNLSQAEFSERFQISKRTLQQWEQRRAMPDMPARLLLKAIELSPDAIARAAKAMHAEILSRKS